MNKSNDLHYYDDIIDMLHHQSTTRPHMSIAGRAAQFMPFKAVSGHEEAVHEVERITNAKLELDENAKAILDEKLQIITDNIRDCPEITVTHFVPDYFKEGGEYITFTAPIRKIDICTHSLVFKDGQVITIENIYDLDSKLFTDFVL